MIVRAVFFDMGGTIEKLWFTQEGRRQAAPGLLAMLRSSGIDPGLTEQEFFELLTQGYARYHRWAMDTMEELPTQRVWGEFILAGYQVDPKKLSSISEELMFTLETSFFQRELRPEMPTVLAALQERGYRIGLISNVCSRGQVPISLDKYGIRQYFDPIILSSEYGRRKPDPAIFHFAARLANMPTGACAHVGDRIARDIIGARKAGFALAVQIVNDFDFGEEDEGAEPDAVITRMDQLLGILEEQAAAPVSVHQREAPTERHIKAFLFDAGDILYHRPHGYRKLKGFLSEIGLADRDIPQARRKELRDQAFNGSISQAEYRRAVLGLYGITQPDLVERGSRAIDEDENGVEFFPGVRETLTSLKERGFLLGIITDTANPIHVKLSWFERGGIGDVWDTFISSKEIGVEKPDPRIYAAALTQLGLQANQAIFVGHNQGELQGAHAHGMKTVAFNYEKSIQADYYIEKFDDLLQIPVADLEIQPD